MHTGHQIEGRPVVTASVFVDSDHFICIRTMQDIQQGVTFTATKAAVCNAISLSRYSIVLRVTTK